MIFARDSNGGRGTDSPGGRHHIQTNGVPTNIIPQFFMPDALPATLPIYPGLGQAPIYAGLHTWWLG